MRSAIFVVLALASAAVLAADEQPAVRPRVTVSSQPSGATVSVDGMDRGVTPLVIYDLGPGRHHLRYRLAGYEDRDRFFTMDEGPVLEKSETLVPEKGLLLLRSDPPGCAILVVLLLIFKVYHLLKLNASLCLFFKILYRAL